METSKSLGSGFPCFVFAAIIVLSGCSTIKVGTTVKVKTETELAVEAIQLEWLKRCDPFVGTGVPPNEVGALLQDYVDMSVAYAECMHRHNGLVEYLRPIVKKERGFIPANP